MNDVMSRGSKAVMATYKRTPVELVDGRGCRVVDREGRTYLDLVAGIAVNVLGHAHPALTRAASEAAEGLWHVSNLYWTEPMVRLAERLTHAAGQERAFFCNSGAEAVEASLKMARRARPGRAKFVVFERSFHGRTFGALSATLWSGSPRPSASSRNEKGSVVTSSVPVGVRPSGGLGKSNVNSHGLPTHRPSFGATTTGPS